MLSLRILFLGLIMTVFASYSSDDYIRPMDKYFNGVPSDVQNAANKLFASLDIQIATHGFHFTHKINGEFTLSSAPGFTFTKRSYREIEKDFHEKTLTFMIRKNSNGNMYTWTLYSQAINDGKVRHSLMPTRNISTIIMPHYMLVDWKLTVN